MRPTCDTIGRQLQHFNDFVRGEIKRQQTTQEALAEYLGCDQSTLSCMIRGTTCWKFKNVLKTCEFFGTSLEEISKIL